MRTIRLSWLLGALIFCDSSPAWARDCVTPSDRVVNAVLVRETPSTEGTTTLGSLSPGTVAEVVGAVPGWYQVALAPEQFGYVSKAWTRRVPCIGNPVGEPATDAPGFEVHAIDVGTGLAILVRGADFTLIYDGGSNDDLALGDNNRLLAYLATLTPAIARIDHLLLSHPHRDHVELLPDLLSKLPVSHLWDSGRVYDICGYRSFLRKVADNPQIRYHTAMHDREQQSVSFPARTCYGEPLPAEDIPLNYDARIAFDPIPLGQQASMTFLLADGAPHGSPNENSLVVRLTLGGASVLLVGDAEAGGRSSPTTPPTPKSLEGRLLSCCKALLPADVLVVGHHGSMSSSRTKFLDAIGARHYIVSSGPYKYSGVTLPDAVVINELRSRGAVWETYVEDAQCRTATEKIGPAADGKAGGCENIVLNITGSQIVGVKTNGH